MSIIDITDAVDENFRPTDPAPPILVTLPSAIQPPIAVIAAARAHARWPPDDGDAPPATEIIRRPEVKTIALVDVMDEKFLL
ncbi:hypothetical protein AB0B45_34620 [Nonomuraea sp. NPDC049152]|uniref:hypothetical protein n=1 Tax=Nonomuraea sp. NPDC049152 TaxID=3154350 RepID=UPI00340DE476